ncbi:OmpP1/FadL family transporter [Cellulophaga fucicola]|uniref:OmpP1/FadL family transporter n=1 Tax=Cellulophaga fucicola TaxID=76595 RepID=UPI003EBECEC6
MKNYIVLAFGLVCSMATAQNINDALLYSQQNTQGTARYQGMSGAFGALGGDLSALNINPAGAAVFNNHLFSATLSNYNKKNSSNYFGTNRESKENYLEINQVGGVMVFKANNSNWKKIAIAANYDLVQNFDNNFAISGNSNQGIDQYFLSYADGTPYGPLKVRSGEYLEEAYLDIGNSLGFRDQQAFLGIEGGVISPVSNNDNNNSYVKNADYTTVDQNYFENTTGYNSKFILDFATQYQDNLYLGASLNFHSINYDKYTEFTETGYASGSPISRTTFDNYLHTEGNGFSFALGAIAKVNEFVRIGASYESPTWYRLTDDTAQRISSDLANPDINFINFNIVNLYEEYKIKTPAKATGSLAVIFGKSGLLSLDYGYQDMSNAEIRPTNDPGFASANEDISNELGAVSTLRFGGEYRIDDISLRAGYRYEQSPYLDEETIGDLNGFSLGFGYSFGPNRIDLAYNRAEQDVNKQLFNAGLNTPAFVNNVNTNITVGYTVNF